MVAGGPAQAAELHDVGKLGIPDEILGKPGPLDPEEWGFVRRHPLVGERIIGAGPAWRPRPGQFDPAVVDAFSELVVELVWPSAPAAPSRVSRGAR